MLGTFLSRISGGIGIIMLGIGTFLLIHELAFLSHDLSANATVISLARDVNSTGEPVQCPVLSFTTADGQTAYYEASDFCANPPRYQVGQTIQVLYDPQNPKDAQFSGIVGEFGVAILLIFLGLAFFCFAVWIYFWARKMRRGAMEQGS